MSDKIKINIDNKVLSQMYEYAHYAHHHYKSEIAGWAHYNIKNGIYKLAPLLKQEALPADVETFPDDILNDTNYDIHDMFVQWHSHVYMGCTPSITDKDLIEDALQTMPMIISIIVNCKNEYTAILTIKKAGLFQFNDQIKFDVELRPYYNNPIVSKDVKSKLYIPKPPQPVQPVQATSRIYGFYHGFNGYWENGTFIITGNNSNGSENKYDNYLPSRGTDLPDIDKIIKNKNLINQKVFDVNTYIEMAYDLEAEYPTDLAIMSYANFTYISSKHFQLILMIGKNGLSLNGEAIKWNDAMTKMGITDKKYMIIE